MNGFTFNFFAKNYVLSFKILLTKYYLPKVPVK